MILVHRQVPAQWPSCAHHPVFVLSHGTLPPLPCPCAHRRRVMATLGELLFYIATQQQDAANGQTAQEVSDCWNINSATISAVVRWVWGDGEVGGWGGGSSELGLGQWLRRVAAHVLGLQQARQERGRSSIVR